MRVILVPLLLLSTALPSSCALFGGPRAVSLPTMPSRDAPLAEREAWLRQQKPLDHIGSRALVLQSGAQVNDVHDLTAYVDADSATARAVKAADDAAGLQNTIVLAASVGLAAGFGAMFASPLLLLDDNAPTFTDASLGLLAGGTVLAVVSALGLSLAEEQAVEVEVQRSAAMITWEGDTRRRLGLDATGSLSTAPAPAPQEAATEGERAGE